MQRIYHSLTKFFQYPTAKPNHFITEIVSGGQTGVDRAALDIAIKLNIAHGGWCPYQRQAEDGTISLHYNLKEAPAPTLAEKNDPDAIYKVRTELNARDSDGTLIIIKDKPVGGTLFTIKMAEQHRKPHFILKVDNQLNFEEVINWIYINNIHKMNVAGPRASQTKGIYDLSYNILNKILFLLQQQAYITKAGKKPQV